MRGAVRSVWVLRAVVVVGLMVALLAGVPEGLVPSAAVVVVVLLGALVSAFRPEHLVLSVTLGIVLVWWALQVHADVPVGCLVAAAAITAVHVAAVLLGYGPPRMPVGSDLVALWVVRGSLVWLAAPAIWVVARAYRDHDTPTAYWLVGLATALVGAVVAAVVVPIQGAENDR
jgi:hypothetical protein